MLTKRIVHQLYLGLLLTTFAWAASSAGSMPSQTGPVAKRPAGDQHDPDRTAQEHHLILVLGLMGGWGIVRAAGLRLLSRRRPSPEAAADPHQAYDRSHGERRYASARRPPLSAP